MSTVMMMVLLRTLVGRVSINHGVNFLFLIGFTELDFFC